MAWHDHDGHFETGSQRAVTAFAFGSGWTYGAPYDTAAGGRFLALVPPSPLRLYASVSSSVGIASSRGSEFKNCVMFRTASRNCWPESSFPSAHEPEAGSSFHSTSAVTRAVHK